MNKHLELKIGEINYGVAKGFGIAVWNKETKSYVHATIISDEHTGVKVAQQLSLLAFEYTCKYILNLDPNEEKKKLINKLTEDGL